MLHSTPGIWDARIQWVDDNNQCFDSQDTCSLEYNITWFVTSGGPVHSDATAHPKNEFTITGLRPNTGYTATVRAQCQADKYLSSQESVIFFRTAGMQSKHMAFFVYPISSNVLYAEVRSYIQ